MDDLIPTFRLEAKIYDRNNLVPIVRSVLRRISRMEVDIFIGYVGYSMLDTGYGMVEICLRPRMWKLDI